MLPPLILAAGGLSAMITQQWLKHVYSSRSIPAYTSPFVAMSWVLLLFAEPSAPMAHIEMSTLNLLAAELRGWAR
jgi:urea transporter